jgi:hypothetical protein
MSSRGFSKEIEDKLDSDLSSGKREKSTKKKDNKENPKSKPERKEMERSEQKDDRIMVTVEIPRKALSQLWKASGVAPDASVKAEARLFSTK